ncbi:MAG: FAD-dependent oxidoreductase [Dehalococcoidales bacterium]|nr:FAD-dependent oxidoreductase [Dehalococcoidales bacterium]
MRVQRKNFVTAPCNQACPVGIDVPRYIRYIKAGRFDEALAVNREKLPLPSVCANACFAPCEDVCAYRQLGDPLAIRALKRAAVDRGGDYWKRNKRPAASTGKKVAIAGAGPAGLTAAYYLANQGHAVTVYDSFPKPGGMMRYGVPQYRLPEAELDRDVKEIDGLGVEFKLNTTIGKDIALDEMKKKYDAVFLASGANQSARIQVEGSDRPGVLWGWEFLRDVALGKKPELKGAVTVIGGGNVAVDVALVARRLGAAQVALVCLEKEGEMPAHDWEVARAREEGVTIYGCWAPGRINGDGSVNSIDFIKCVSVFDKTGKFNPVCDENDTFKLETDNVILAVGQTADLGFLDSTGRVEVSGGRVMVDAETLATGEPGVFAGGDVVSGPASIIEAVAQGRKAAVSIDRYLGGEGAIDEELATPEEEVDVPPLDTQVKPRVPMPLLTATARANNFRQIEQGYSEEQAIEEAARCLYCDARLFEVTVYPENCKECGYCMEVCGLGIITPTTTFNKKGYRPVEAKSSDRCIGCLKCFFSCPDYAIDVKDITGRNGREHLHEKVSGNR